MNILNKITVSKILDIMTVSSKRGQNEKMINRPHYGISFCIDGQITYIHKGKEYISDKNHAVILPKDESYSITRNKNGLFPVINFDCIEFLCDKIIVIPIENSEMYIRLYNKIKKLYIFDNQRQKIMSIFYDILSLLSSEGSNYGVIAPAISYIQAHFYDRTLSNSELADLCNISESYFRKIFYKQFKMSPKQYIIDARILKAKDLLIEGNLKIQSICEECGFTNQYHFCRIFKEKTGLSPRQYRAKNKVIII